MEETSGVDQPFYLNDTETVTSDHLRSSDMRSLGDNVKLLAVIENLSSDLVSKSENAYKKIDEIDRESEVKSVAVKNLINEFQMLADSQFMENRIYDEDTIDLHGEITENPTADLNDTNKSSPDQKILPIIHECISSSLQFIDEKFDLPNSQIRQQNGSDEEEDYVKEALAKAYESNPFNKTPLPSIIGSQEFFNQSLFNDGGNQATETNREYYSEPSDKLSDDNAELESQDSDEEEQNLFTTINDSIRNYPLNSSSMQTEKKLDGKDEVGPLNNSQFSTGLKAEIERKAIEKKPVAFIDEFSDDGDDDDDDLFTTSSSKIRTPIAKMNESAKSTKEEKVDEESKVVKVPIIVPPSITSEQIKSVHNSNDRTESDDSSDDSLFNDFKSKLSKILTNKPTNDKSDSKRVSKEIRSPSTSSISSKDNAENKSTIQPQNNVEKNLFGETSDDEKDDLFAIKNKSIAPSLVEKFSDDDDDDLFTTSSSKIQTPIAKINDSVRSKKEEKVDKEPKVMKVPLNIPSTKTSEQIKSTLTTTSNKRPESDDSSDDSLFSDFKSKLSQKLVEKKVDDKVDLNKNSLKETQSTAARKENSETKSETQRSSNLSDKKLFDEISDEDKNDFQFVSKSALSASSKIRSERKESTDLPNKLSSKNLFGDASDDDLFQVKNKPRNPPLLEESSDDDLFATSPKNRTSISNPNNRVNNLKEENVDEESKVVKVPIDVPPSNTSEQIKSVHNSSARTESDDSSDDSLFSDFKSKLSKILTNKPTNGKRDSKVVSKEIRSHSISSTSSKDNTEKKPETQLPNKSIDKNLLDEFSDDGQNDLQTVSSPALSTSSKERKEPTNLPNKLPVRNLLGDTSDDDQDDLFAVKNKSTAPPPVRPRNNFLRERENSIRLKKEAESSGSNFSEDSGDSTDDLFLQGTKVSSPVTLNSQSSNSSSKQTEKKIDLKDEVDHLSKTQFSTGQKAEVERKVIEKRPISLIDEFSDDDDDLFTTSSSKIRTPIAKINDSAKSTKEEKVDEESKVMEVSLNIPSSKASEQIRSTLNTAIRPESDDSSDDSLFSDFKSKASSKLVERKANDNDEKKSPFVHIAQSSTLSTARKEDFYKNLFDGTSDDDQDDLFAVKNESKPPPVKPRYNLRKTNSQQEEKTDP